MIEFGKTLREAREAKGYTVSQIAEMTHLKPSLVEQLENEDFSSIAAPIYGRGFVKLYSEAVGLEAKPLVDEFMAIMNGEHEVAIRERPIAADEPRPQPPPPAPEPVFQPTPQPTPQPVSQPTPPPAAPAPEPDLFNQAPAPAPLPPPPVSAQAASAAPYPEQAPEPAQSHNLSRYAASFDGRTRESPPPVLNMRIAVLAALALALLVVLVLGIRSLYRATSSDAPETNEQAVAEAPVETAAPAEPAPAVKPAPSVPAAKATPRAKLQNIPSLYID